MPAISVIMPVYNTEENYLREAIESILNQTFEDFEFLILNDGSTNNVQEVLESYDDKRIKIIQGEHKGIGYARNCLVKMAQGKYIAKMDSDDISLPKRLEKQYNYLETHPEVSILGSFIKCFPQEKIIKSKTNPCFLDFLRGCSLAHPTVMMRRCDLEKYNLNYDKNLKISEDYDLWSRAIRYLKIENLADVLLYYRILQNSLSRTNQYATMKQDDIIRKNMLNFLSTDTKIQKEVYKLVSKPKFIKKIFSIGNEWYKDKQYKSMVIFGIKIRLFAKRH